MKLIVLVFLFLVFVFQVTLASFQVNVTTFNAPTSKLYAKAAVLSNGRALVHGGTSTGSSAGVTGDAFYFDPSTNTFSAANLQNSPKLYAHSIAVDTLNETVYFFGGRDQIARKNSIYRCNLPSKVCQLINVTSSAPGIRTLAGLVYYKNSLIVFGGGNAPTFYNDVWQFDLYNNTWTNRIAQGSANGPAGRTAPCVTVHGDQLLVVGGTSSSFSVYYQDTWILDLNTWTWNTNTTSLLPPTVHSDAACTVAGDHLLLYGGSSGSSTNSKTLDVFHVPTRTWVASIVNTAGVAKFGIAHFYHNGTWYLYGGAITSAYTANTLDLYTLDEPEFTIGVTTDTSTAFPECDPPTPVVSVVNSTSTYTLPSQPTVQISYNGGNLFFQVLVDFVQNETSYFLDFASTNVLPNAIPSYCSNHYNSNSTSVDNDQWESPPDYYAAAYSNYGTWPTSLLWYKSIAGCNQINYQANISLTGCSDQNGSPMFSLTTEGDKIVLEGTLHIALNRAHSIYRSDRVDNLMTWRQPFRLEMSNVVASVTSLTVEGEGSLTPRVDPAKIGISENGGLILQVVSELLEATPVTSTSTGGGGATTGSIVTDDALSTTTGGATGATDSSALATNGPVEISSLSGTTYVRAGNPVVLSSPVSLVLSSNSSNGGSACVSPCTQTWTWNSVTNSPDYSGVYRFQFTILSANSKRFTVGSTFSVSLKIQLKPTATVYLNASSFPSELSLFRSNFYYNPANSFGAKERVYAIQAISTTLNVRLAMRNAWFCYDAIWNPAIGQMGCLSAEPSKVVRLVSNGYILNNTSQEPYTASFSNSAVGLSFVAVPLSTNSQNYLLHIESTVQTVGNKRSNEGTTKQQVISFTVAGSKQEPISEEVNSDASTLSILFVFVILSIASFVMVI